MLPSEFINRYGTPTSYSLHIEAGGSAVITPNEDRYLLAFWYTSTQIRIFPSYDDGVAVLSYNFNVNELPIILSHSLHGSLVNLGWTITNVAVFDTADVVVIDGRMGDLNKRSKRRK